MEEVSQEKKQEAVQKMNKRITRQLKSPVIKMLSLSEIDGNVRKPKLRGKRKSNQSDIEMLDVVISGLKPKRNKVTDSSGNSLQIKGREETSLT